MVLTRDIGESPLSGSLPEESAQLQLSEAEGCCDEYPPKRLKIMGSLDDASVEQAMDIDILQKRSESFIYEQRINGVKNFFPFYNFYDERNGHKINSVCGGGGKHVE